LKKSLSDTFGRKLRTAWKWCFRMEIDFYAERTWRVISRVFTHEPITV